MGSPWLSQEKNFQNISFQKAGKCYFKIGICVLLAVVQALYSLQLQNYLILSLY